MFDDGVLNDLAQTSQTLGKALSFHTVSFGTDYSSHSLRRMADLAAAIFARSPNDLLSPPDVGSCSYTRAIDTVSGAQFFLSGVPIPFHVQISLAETFLGFAESLQKQRASLLRG